ncbi:unnamed protein product, partial [Medioppia subpectinata]
MGARFYTSIESNIRPVKHKLKASALQFMYSMDITSDCLDSLFTWFEALKRNELWAYQRLYDMSLQIYLAQLYNTT